MKEDGFFHTSVAKVIYEIGKDNNNAVKIDKKFEYVSFISRNIVMATGGKQRIPSNFFKQYNLKKSVKVLCSDDVLREEGFKSLLKQIQSLDG
jgi:hypothetical protein